MSILSETEATLHMDQVLQALPVLRRWLLRSAPIRHMEEGTQTPTPLSHIRVLVHLFQHGPMSVGELARGLGISCSTATECVAALEARGRVVKYRPESDRRQVIVSLTPEAKAVALKVHSQRKVIVERVLRQLSPTERRAFVKGLVLIAKDGQSWMEGVALSEEVIVVEEALRA